MMKELLKEALETLDSALGYIKACQGGKESAVYLEYKKRYKEIEDQVDWQSK